MEDTACESEAAVSNVVNAAEEDGLDRRDGHAREQQPAEKAQAEHEELALVAVGLLLAEIQRLHHAEIGVLAEVHHRKAVAVCRDDTGDDEKERPQADKDALDDGEQDGFACERKRVEQALIRHMLAAADAETVAEVACVEHDGDETDEDADEAEREHREPAGGVDHVAHGGIDDVEHEGDGEQQRGHLEGGRCRCAAASGTRP